MALIVLMFIGLLLIGIAKTIGGILWIVIIFLYFYIGEGLFENFYD